MTDTECEQDGKRGRDRSKESKRQTTIGMGIIYKLVLCVPIYIICTSICVYLLLLILVYTFVGVCVCQIWPISPWSLFRDFTYISTGSPRAKSLYLQYSFCPKKTPLVLSDTVLKLLIGLFHSVLQPPFLQTHNSKH